MAMVTDKDVFVKRAESQARLQIVKGLDPALWRGAIHVWRSAPALIDEIVDRTYGMAVTGLWGQIMLALTANDPFQRWSLGKAGSLRMTDENQQAVIQHYTAAGVPGKRWVIAKWTVRSRKAEWRVVSYESDLRNLLDKIVNPDSFWTSFKSVAFSSGGGTPHQQSWWWKSNRSR